MKQEADRLALSVVGLLGALRRNPSVIEAMERPDSVRTALRTLRDAADSYLAAAGWDARKKRSRMVWTAVLESTDDMTTIEARNFLEEIRDEIAARIDDVVSDEGREANAESVSFDGLPIEDAEEPDSPAFGGTEES